MLVNRAWHDSNGLFKEYVVLPVGISCCRMRVCCVVVNSFIIMQCFGDIVDCTVFTVFDSVVLSGGNNRLVSWFVVTHAVMRCSDWSDWLLYKYMFPHP